MAKSKSSKPAPKGAKTAAAHASAPKALKNVKGKAISAVKKAAGSKPAAKSKTTPAPKKSPGKVAPTARVAPKKSAPIQAPAVKTQSKTAKAASKKATPTVSKGSAPKATPKTTPKVAQKPQFKAATKASKLVGGPSKKATKTGEVVKNGKKSPGKTGTKTPPPVKATAEKAKPAEKLAARVNPPAQPSTRPVVARTLPSHANKGQSLIPENAPEIKKPAKPLFPARWVQSQQERILELRDSILENMHGVAQDTLRSRAEGSEASAFGMHQADAGSDAYDRDFALSLLSQEQDALYEIEEALKRIQLGTYGICEMSGKQIPVARLEALPFARYTVECQAEVERQGKMHKARVPVTSLFGLTEEESQEAEEEEPSPDSKE
jgi:DnaK suppressor protein